MGFFSLLRDRFLHNRVNWEETDFIVFGLGNPGRKYLTTRHNIGFRIVDQLVASLDKTTTTVTRHAEITRGTLDSATITAAVKPLTFMNNSGRAVSEVLEKCNHRSKQQKYIVVVDDINIPFGTLRVRGKGTHGGHNGLRSIIDTIGAEFIRLRVGVGPVHSTSDIIEFVLGNFSPEEEQQLPDIIKKGTTILKSCAVESLSTVMNTYN